MFNITAHAFKRMKQRGITREMIINAINYGYEKIYNNCAVYTLTKSIIKKMCCGMSENSSIEVVISNENNVITVYRMA